MSSDDFSAVIGYLMGAITNAIFPPRFWWMALIQAATFALVIVLLNKMRGRSA